MDTRGKVARAAHFHLVPRSRMHGDIPALSHIFMVWFLIKHRDPAKQLSYSDQAIGWMTKV